MSFTTELLTFSEEKLSPEAALEWLATEYVALEKALSCGFLAEDKDDRVEFQFLAMDLARLHEAALIAMNTQEPVVVRCTGPDHAVDFESHTRALARVVAQSHLEEHAYSPAGRGFRRLGEMLVTRLASPEAVSPPEEEEEVSESEASSGATEQAIDAKATEEDKFPHLNFLWPLHIHDREEALDYLKRSGFDLFTSIEEVVLALDGFNLLSEQDRSNVRELARCMLTNLVEMLQWVHGLYATPDYEFIMMDSSDALRRLTLLHLLIGGMNWTDPARWLEPIAELHAAYEKAEAEGASA